MKAVRLAPTDAARALDGLHALDPSGVMRPEDVQAMCARGHCIAIEVDGDRSVIVIRRRGKVLWVDALAGRRALDAAEDITQRIGRALGCTAIAWQTARRGLMREGQRRGYAVSGFILTKALQ